MPELLKKQVYRSSFIAYTLALFVTCAVVALALCSLIINTQVAQVKQETQRAFESAQNTIALHTQRIDNYFLGLYAEYNQPVLKDFMRFFGKDAEEYMTVRLSETAAANSSNSFIENIKSFVASNRYAVSQVSVIAQQNMNVINYQSNGNSQISFRMPHLTAGPGNNIAKGFVYTKKILQPGDHTVTLGEVSFLISPDGIFDELTHKQYYDTAVISEDGALFFDADEETKQQFRNIYSSAINEGSIGTAFLSTLHYTTVTSDRYGFKVISIVTDRQIVNRNQTLFFFVGLGVLFIFVSVTMLIATRMTYDARYLDRIMQAINHAKSGHFSAIDVERRKDEFSIIAKNLNDMSEQLEEHIHREYILRLRQIEADMRSLQQQINPHFLYNTLEVIRSCALINKDEAVAEAVYNLGGMFRDMVKGDDVIVMQTELDILSKYLKIMEFKYPGKFFYQIDLSAETLSLSTIKFWMQPLVENFFVHGFDKAGDFNLLLIREQQYDDGVCLEFVDNGAQIDASRLQDINTSLLDPDGRVPEHGGIGLRNVYTRLSYFYGSRLRMGLRNNAEAGITVFVCIPKEGVHVSSADCG